MDRDRIFQRGFSLLEVLVAFAILSITLGVLLQAFATGVRGTALSEDYTRATLHAESILAALGRELPLEQSVMEASIDDKFFWRSTVAPYYVEGGADTSDAPVTPYRVVVEVFWQESGFQPRSVVLETLRLVPDTP